MKLKKLRKPNSYKLKCVRNFVVLECSHCCFYELYRGKTKEFACVKVSDVFESWVRDRLKLRSGFGVRWTATLSEFESP
jgi:hypothetical protein